MEVGREKSGGLGEDAIVREALQDPTVQQLGQELRSGAITRGSFLRRVGFLGLSVSATASLLAACGGGSGSSTAAQTTATTGTGGGGKVADKFKNKTIGVVHLTEADENEKTLVKALEEAAEKAELNWTFQQADSQGEEGKAQAAIEAFVTQKVDAIIPLVIAARMIEKQLGDAKAAEIPVFGEWTFSELNPNLVVDYTSVPAADASALAGFMFSHLYEEIPTGEIQVALVNTDLDILQSRNVTVRAIAELYPRAKIVDSANISLTDINGSTTNIANGFLSKYPNLNALWANYPPTGPVAAAAVEARGKTSQVGVYTHVAEKAGIESLQDPNSPLTAMPWLDFDWESYHLVEQMLNFWAGNPVPRLLSYEVIVPFQVFTKETAKEGLTGTGVANGVGWTLLEGTWKDPLVETWKSAFKG